MMLRLRRTALALPAMLTVLAAILASPPLHAEDPAGSGGNLIADLGSSDYSVRQRATLALQAGGEELLPQIVAAVQAADAEIRSRAWNILLAHALSPRGDVREAARDAIRRLSDRSSGETNGPLMGGLSRVREAMSGQATADLTRLGATVMSVQGGSPFTFNVQIGQGWRGGDERLALLTDLGSVPWLSLESSRVTDAALDHLSKLAGPASGITKLYLGSSGITGATLEKLAPLKRLQYLSLKQLPIDDEKIARLPEFPDLQYLGLDGTKIGDEGLAHLGRFPRLQVIWLDNTAITDAGLAHLKKLPNLDTLYMPGTNTGGLGLANLRYVSKLKSISLKGVKFSTDGLKSLSQVEHLESLGLDMTNVSDNQLADLEGLKQLRILWLSGTNVGDDGMEHLKALPSLQIVHLNNTLVTREGVAALERALPRCQITIDFSNRRDSAGHGNQPTPTQPRLAQPRFPPRPPAP
ncbi:MAG TPA: hypothetical protein VGI40_08220 [Pirellulaceae bacterium]|jgi:hypothetical protein